MERSKIVGQWLDTFSKVKEMAENQNALALELSAIVGVFDRAQASEPEIAAVFNKIKLTSDSRAWPTVAQVYVAMNEIRTPINHDEVAAGSQRGDRSKLNGIELAALDTKVLPAARRHLRTHPGLRQHAAATLEYWREEIRDDRGVLHKMQAKEKSD